MDTESVILAIASPPGHAPRGIIRLSGARCFDVLAPHLELQDAADNATPWTRGIHRAVLVGLLPAEIPCLAAIFPAPRSYTGENVAEIQVPGNPRLLERLIDRLLDSAAARRIDARRAQGGEFTARAFLNGKMDLTAAEGVAATIAARSDAELRAARLLTGGTLATLARTLTDALAATLALVEAGIDFTDQEHVSAIEPGELHARLRGFYQRIDASLQRAVAMERLEAIPWVVLAGEPNAGKSTLFNALLGRDRAVVSSLAGTTRDVLAEPLTITTSHGEAEVMLVDLAGPDERDTILNRQMQSLAAEAFDRAELVLRCIPTDERCAPAKPGEVVIRTKADLADPDSGPTGQIAVSARTGAGLEALFRVISQKLADRAVSLAADAIALSPRHEAALHSARDNLAAAIDLTAAQPPRGPLDEPELLAASMRAALDDLAALAGAVMADDVLGRIFASFCVGK